LAGEADLDQLPIDSLKHIKETYKAFKAIAARAAAGGQLGGAVPAQASGASQVSSQYMEQASVIQIDMPIPCSNAAAILTPHCRANAAWPCSNLPRDLCCLPCPSWLQVTSCHDAAMMQSGAVEPDAVGVGDIDASQGSGFWIGTAPTQARPGPGTQMMLRHVTSSLMPGAVPVANASSTRSPRNNLQQPSPRLEAGSLHQHQQQAGSATDVVDRNVLYSRYKYSIPQGQQLAEQVKRQQQQVANLKQQIKVIAASQLWV
jgi:hypothetical protein